MARTEGEEEWMEKGSWPENVGIIDYLIGLSMSKLRHNFGLVLHVMGRVIFTTM